MKTQLFRARRMLGAALAVALVCFAAASVLSTKKTSNQEEALPVANKTKGIEIVNLQLSGGDLRFGLKNNYSQSITAYALSIEKVESTLNFSEDFIYGDKPIASGEIRLITIPIAQSLSTDKAGERRFVFQGVIFEDRTNDGDFNSIRSIEDTRMGSKQFLVQLLPLIRAFLSLPETSDSFAYESLLSSVSSLQISVDAKQSDQVMRGFNETKELVSRKLGEIKRLAQGSTVHERLSEFEVDRKVLVEKL